MNNDSSMTSTPKPKIEYGKQFKKDVKRIKRSGKDMQKLLRVIDLLMSQTPLPDRCRPHKLTGDYKDWWECHIEPDWLLVYKADAQRLKLARTGSHSDLFE